MANKVIVQTTNYRIEGDHHLIGAVIRNADDVTVATLQGDEYVELLDRVDNAPEHMQDVVLDAYDNQL